MPSELSTDSTKTSTNSDSSTATSKGIIEVPTFYHQQWAPEYPEFVNFRYDGTIYQIRLRQRRAKVYFAEGLKKFRKDLSIYESMIIKFLACNNKSMFDLYFVPSLECQTCGRPEVMSRQHIWTLEITQSILGAPGPLVTMKTSSMLLINSCLYIMLFFSHAETLQLCHDTCKCLRSTHDHSQEIWTSITVECCGG
ncbi:hypothetical protein AAZX31_04G104400 [Glycine max]